MKIIFIAWRSKILFYNSERDQKSQWHNAVKPCSFIVIRQFVKNYVITYDVIVRWNGWWPPFFILIFKVQAIICQLAKKFKKLFVGTITAIVLKFLSTLDQDEMSM